MVELTDEILEKFRQLNYVNVERLKIFGNLCNFELSEAELCFFIAHVNPSVKLSIRGTIAGRLINDRVSRMFRFNVFYAKTGARICSACHSSHSLQYDWFRYKATRLLATIAICHRRNADAFRTYSYIAWRQIAEMLIGVAECGNYGCRHCSIRRGIYNQLLS